MAPKWNPEASKNEDKNQDAKNTSPKAAWSRFWSSSMRCCPRKSCSRLGKEMFFGKIGLSKKFVKNAFSTDLGTKSASKMLPFGHPDR